LKRVTPADIPVSFFIGETNGIDVGHQEVDFHLEGNRGSVFVDSDFCRKNRVGIVEP
jgi:hypothetical protein